MSVRTTRSLDKLLADLEGLRLQHNWVGIQDVLHRSETVLPATDALHLLVRGEAQLELALQRAHAPPGSGVNSSRVSLGPIPLQQQQDAAASSAGTSTTPAALLQTAVTLLQSALGASAPQPRVTPALLVEARNLLGRALLADDRAAAAVAEFSAAALVDAKQPSTTTTPRATAALAQAYACHGIAVEAAVEAAGGADPLALFLRASDLALARVFTQPKALAAETSATRDCEHAISRAIDLLCARIVDAALLARRVLQVNAARPRFQRHVGLQYARLLLRNPPGPFIAPAAAQAVAGTAARSASHHSSVFVPASWLEEALLLLLLEQGHAGAAFSADARDDLVVALALAGDSARVLELLLQNARSQLGGGPDEMADLIHALSRLGVTQGQHLQALQLASAAGTPSVTFLRLLLNHGGDPAKALQVADAALTSSHAHKPPEHELATLHVLRGVALLQLAVAVPAPKDAAAHEHAAVASFEKALLSDVTLSAAHYFLACVHLRARNFNAALTACQSYLAFHSEDYRGLLLHTHILAALGQPAAALAVCAQIVAAFPADIEAVIIAARLMDATAGPAAALTVCQRALALFPAVFDLPETIAAPEPHKSGRGARGGSGVSSAGLNDSLAAGPSVTLRQSVMPGQFETGASHSAGSAPCLALTAHPANVQTRLWLAISALYRKLKLPDEAARAIVEARLAAISPSALVEAEAAYFAADAGDHEIALKHFRVALGIDVKCVTALQGMALSLLALDRHSLARGFLESLIIETPHNPVAWFLMGKVAMSSAEPDKAADCFLAAAQLRSSDSVVSLPLNTILLTV